MSSQPRMQPIDYLVVGHITLDQTPSGSRLGGTAAFAALTAQALGLRPGIVTAWAEELAAEELGEIPIYNIGAERSTQFENIETESGRRQRILQVAPFLEFHHIPEAWRNTPLVHLAPVAREVSPRILKYFETSFIGATPQGWLREWGDDGAVRVDEWIEAEHMLARMNACVLSLEDLGDQAYRLDQFAASCPVLVATDGSQGATLYTQGDITHIPAPAVSETDPLGAGDVFAASFFVSLYQYGNALEAANLATQMAALSVQRLGLAGVPTRDEVQGMLAEAL